MSTPHKSLQYKAITQTAWDNRRSAWRGLGAGDARYGRGLDVLARPGTSGPALAHSVSVDRLKRLLRRRSWMLLLRW